MLKLSTIFCSQKGIPSQTSLFHHDQVISFNGILLKATHDLKPMRYRNDFWSVVDDFWSVVDEVQVSVLCLFSQDCHPDLLISESKFLRPESLNELMKVVSQNSKFQSFN